MIQRHQRSAVSRCVARAQEYLRRATSEMDPEIKALYERMQSAWQRAADQYEFIDKVNGYLGSQVTEEVRGRQDGDPGATSH
jgi:hypothetical protein